MKNLKHTPGPWKWVWADAETPRLEGNIYYNDMNPVIVLQGYDCGCKGDARKVCPLHPSDADKKLIEAAPEMIEALIKDFKTMFYFYDNGYVEDDLSKNYEKMMNDRQALIEKATGLKIDEIIGE